MTQSRLRTRRSVLASKPSTSALAALRLPRVGRLIKGQPRLLIAGGSIDEAALRREHMTINDFDEDLRGKSVGAVHEVHEARLERNGSLSVLKAK